MPRKKINKKIPMKVRLNKYLADCGIASRRKTEESILTGRVSVNNKIITDLAFKVDSESDVVRYDGEKLNPKRHLYFLLNKPKGVITTTSDEKKRIKVTDLLKIKDKIYPVGRLDYNTTGVLFLTNDGNFSNILTHPKNLVPRIYEVQLDEPLLEKDAVKLQKGIFIEGIKGKFQKVEISRKKNGKVVFIECVEGRNHFVKRMFHALGYTVISLNRKSFAGLKADIPAGSYRKLTSDEVSNIFKVYGNQYH